MREQRFELVGIFNFGAPDSNNSVGQTMAAFDVPTAQQFLGLEGQLLEIGVVVSTTAAKVVSVGTSLTAVTDT